MQEIISFYKGKYIISNNYKHYKYNKKDWTSFLESIDNKYYKKLKLIKINYEAGLTNYSLEKKKSLYSSNLIDIFVLNDFKYFNKKSFKPIIKPIIKPFKANIDKNKYIKIIKKIKNKILNGEYYQINYTNYFSSEYDLKLNPIEIFNHYHNKFKGNYHGLIPLDNGYIITCSPELFIKKTSKILTTEPIKGTIKAGNNEILINSKKEEAELSMIVDLLRNDLNKVTSNNCVKVTKHRNLKDLGNLIHTFSEIKTKTDLNLPKILDKMLPAGSITGCPKSTSVKDINIFENHERSHYTGHFGWWEKNEFCLNILIRSFIFLDNKKVYYHSGGGIVADSVAQNEYSEFLLKGEKINE